MVWGGALAESGDVLGKLIEGVKFFGENLTEIGFGGLGDVDDHGIGGEITEALAVTGEEERESPDEVEPGEKIDGSEKIADEDLIDLEAKTLGIHDAEAGDFFPEGLAAPGPFGGDAVSDGDDKKSQSGESGAEETEMRKEEPKRECDDDDDGEIDAPSD